MANHSCGLPDTGQTELADVLADARRITGRVAARRGWSMLISVGTILRWPCARWLGRPRSVHVEDQVSSKICGHFAGNYFVPTDEMVACVRAAVAVRFD